MAPLITRVLWPHEFPSFYSDTENKCSFVVWPFARDFCHRNISTAIIVSDNHFTCLPFNCMPFAGGQIIIFVLCVFKCWWCWCSLSHFLIFFLLCGTASFFSCETIWFEERNSKSLANDVRPTDTNLLSFIQSMYQSWNNIVNCLLTWLTCDHVKLVTKCSDYKSFVGHRRKFGRIKEIIKR